MPDWLEQAAGMPPAQERAIAPIMPRPAMLAVVRGRSDLHLGRRQSRNGTGRAPPRGNEDGHAALVGKVQIAKDERPPMPDRGMPERDGIRMKPHRFSSLFEHDLQRECGGCEPSEKPAPFPRPGCGQVFQDHAREEARHAPPGTRAETPRRGALAKAGRERVERRQREQSDLIAPRGCRAIY